MESFRDRVSVANAALFRHCMDVPRRLCARWFPHDFKRRLQRPTQRQPERIFLHSASGSGRSACVCWNGELYVPGNRAFARRAVCGRGDAFFATAYAELRAFTLHCIDCVSAAAPGGFSSDEIVNTTSATMDRAPTRRGIVWKTTLILIPIVTLAVLLCLRNVEVTALRQRSISAYGTVPGFQLTNQNGQPFGSAQFSDK